MRTPLVLLALIACAADWPSKVILPEDGPTLQANAKVTTLALLPDSLTLDRGDTARVTCVPKNQHGTPLTNTCTWRSTDTAIAKVSTTLTQTMTVRSYKVGRTLVIGWVPKYSGVRDTSVVIVSDTLLTPPDSVPPDSVPPVAVCESGPLNACPGDDLNALAQAAGTGATIAVGAGRYEGQTVTPKQGQTFRLADSTVLDGGRKLTDWTADAGRWYVGGQSQNNTDHDTRFCATDSPACSLPEQLWVDGKIQKRVLNLATVTAGAWFLDTGADRIYVGSDPTGKTVETSVTPQAFLSGATGVRIVGGRIEHYATGAGNGTIEAGGGWTVDSVVIQDNNATCIRASGANNKIRGNKILRCGEQGIGGPVGAGFLVEGNEIAYANTAGFAPGSGDHKAAGLKISNAGAAGFIIRNNFVHHNTVGLWCDISCSNALYEGNTVEDNSRRGIQYEISYGCVVRDNIIRRNGTGEANNTGVGIWIAQSNDCEVTGNTLEGNRNGILATDRERGSGSQGLYTVTGLWVHQNSIAQTTGNAMGIQGQDGRNPWAAAANNRSGGNQYQCASGTRFIGQNNQTMQRPTWQSQGYDTPGSGATFTGC
jgi:parallel beta-helix repeat protein